MIIYVYAIRRPNMRLFIAINFSDGTRSGLIELRETLRARSERGNFSLDENLHLTLVFLGECDARQTAAVKAAMGEAVSATSKAASAGKPAAVSLESTVDSAGSTASTAAVSLELTAAPVLTASSGSTAATAPFDVLVERVGRFRREGGDQQSVNRGGDNRPGRDRRDGGDIWWAGLRADKALLDLQRGLSERLSAAGFSLDARKYSPHITLGREVVTSAEPWRIKPFGEKIYVIDLMKSERVGGKLTYTSIYCRKLSN